VTQTCCGGKNRKVSDFSVSDLSVGKGSLWYRVRLNRYGEDTIFVRVIVRWRPRGAHGSEVQLTAYIVEILCPQVNEIGVIPRKLSASQQAEVTKNPSKKSLRQLAKEYGVSHEAIRRTINKQLT